MTVFKFYECQYLSFVNRGRLQGKVGGELHCGEGIRAVDPGLYLSDFTYLCCFLTHLEVFGTKGKSMLRAKNM